MTKWTCVKCGALHLGIKHRTNPQGLLCTECAPANGDYFIQPESSGLMLAPDHRALREAVALSVLKCTPELPVGDVVPTCERILDYIINGNK